MKAVVAGDMEYVRLLLRRGADPNKTNAAKISPLAIAARNGKSSRVLLC
jgi:ankyrin repeat protein